MNRYLITTADEKTWKFDRPVIFLGEWCRLYNRKQIWEKMDAIVAEPYGLGQTKKDADHFEARNIEKKLFPVFCELLNRHHGTQHTERFWRIVLGHWFQRIIDVILNRVYTLEECLKNYKISGTTVYCSDQYSLATTDSYSAIWAFNDDRWNNVLTARILDLLQIKDIQIEILKNEDINSQIIKYKFNYFNYNNKKNNLIKLINSYNKIVVNYHDAFIINSYLPKIEEIKLQLLLRQWPQMWRSPLINIQENSNQELRFNLTDQLKTDSNTKLQFIIASLIFDLLPVCYLEGFTYLENIVKQLPWPNSPKFIFTSNNFDTDEVFKIWTAHKVISGMKYITGQHGNNYGVTKNDLEPSIEEVTADKFLTWGWTDGLPQHTPSVVLKTIGKKEGAYNSYGGLLLIELCLYHRINTWDTTAEFVKYFNDQIDFVRQLPAKPRKELTIRFHAAYKYLSWNEEERWNDFDPTLNIEKGIIPIGKLIKKNRLVVHSYDSTGILETLSQNIPTLAFWQNGLDHLRDSAKPYYQILVDAGIVHLSVDSVVAMINTIWDDVDGWWFDKNVQEARQLFCDRYARLSEKPVRELKQIFNDSKVY